MTKLFGTDGIRAKFGEFPLTRDFVINLGETIGCMLSKEDPNPAILIAKDTRLSGDDLENFLIEGILKYPVNIHCLGKIPTPAISYFTKKYNANLGVMISASHNLSEDNGIKFFAHDGFKISEGKEKNIEDLVLKSKDKKESLKNAVNKGRIINRDHLQVIDEYVEFTKGVTHDINLKGIKIVIDCAHGAVCHVADKIFEELGAEVITLNDKPDGTNINLDCGSQHPEVITRSVVENKAQAGFSFDGDGDRVILSDEKGRVLDGDYILAMVGLDLSRQKRLKKNTLVATIMSNMGLDEALSKNGISVLKSKVGDKYVVQKMIEEGLNVGGEQSGHVVFFDYTPTGDGIITALKILKLMKSSNKYLSELSSLMEKFPQVLLNVKVRKKKDLSQIPQFYSLKNKYEKELGKKGRIVIRYSGTEPLLRIMIEGKDLSVIKNMSGKLAELVKKDIGVL